VKLARLVLALMMALAAVAPRPAAARSDRTLAYAVAKVFPAAVRFLRVDEGLTITEKDADAGYVMFELEQDGKTFPGALELVVTESAGRSAVKLVLRIEDRPSYVETAMLDRLERKLRAELGSEPPPVVKPPPAPPKADKSPEKPDDDKKPG
jgi:hypothetical protein